MTQTTAPVGLIMGSNSDWKVMSEAKKILDSWNIAAEAQVVSAHRTPERMVEYAQKARERGLKIIIAGAGGAAHLPGMVASLTTLPVIGVPILSRHSLQGFDSLLSMAQMPKGIPVATVAVDGAANAAILAAEILALHDPSLQEQLTAYRRELKEKVEKSSLKSP